MRAIFSKLIVTIAIAMIVTTLQAAAFEPALSSADVRAAENAGNELARAHQGYPVANYVVYAVPDALVLMPKQGSIDAVVIATPYERVRYASYLARFQNIPLRYSDVRDAVQPYSVDFIVFAHSSSKEDEPFLNHFGTVTARLRGYGQLQPVSKTSFGPTLDFYTIPGLKRALRWIGYDSYHFDLRALTTHSVDITKLSGTFSITDPYGHRYDMQFDLGRFR